MRRVFVIAEAGVNHNGSLAIAKKLILQAKISGADAVKFQSFKAEKLLTRRAPKAPYQNKTVSAQESQWHMIKRLELGEGAHQQIAAYCRDLNIEFMSTPFDEESLEMLLRLGIRRIKVPSGEITNPFLLQKVARSGLPVILSTGMATLSEIRAALKILKRKPWLLHCVSEYPAPFGEMNLLAMRSLKKFLVPVGLSDHSLGIAVPMAAAALGAVAIEKHLTLSKTLPGPDHRASLDPKEFALMVQGIRQVEMAMGHAKKAPTRSELRNRAAIRKSLVAATAIRKGERLTMQNLTAKRPGTGISPMRYVDFIGNKSRYNYQQDEMIRI